MELIEELTAQPVRRDRWSRYLVVPPEGGKPVGYTRATTIAKTLDEQSNLVAWKARMVAIGLGKSPALVDLASSVDVDDKKTLNDIVERAAEAGGATVRRDQGTALHAALEASWHDVSAAAETFKADVLAVHAALDAAGLTPVAGLFERMIVVDELQVAGMFDLAVKDAAGNLYVADVKTGASLYGALGFAIQLAIYSRASAIYTQGAAADGSEDRRDEVPAFNQDIAYILHIQPKSGHCDILPLDITIGAIGLDMAMQVRQIRKAKPLGKPLDEAVAKIVEAFPGAVELVSEEWRAWMRERLFNMLAQGHGDEITRAWPDGVPTLKSGDDITVEQGEAIAKAVERVEANHTMPFPEPEPEGKIDRGQAVEAWASRIDSKPDEGGEASVEVVLAINARAKALSSAQRELVTGLLAKAAEVESPVSLTGPHGEPTQRKELICSALIDVASVAEDIATAAALIGAATGRSVDPSEIGRRIGALTMFQAINLGIIARAIGDPLGVIYQIDGSVEITGDVDAAISAALNAA